MDKKNRPLTVKQKAFVKELIDNPKQSATQAVLNAYNRPDKQLTRGSASQIAFDNLRKPNIVSKLQDYSELVESALVDTVKDWKDHEKPRQREIALDSAKFIHDKIYGKSKQQVEVSTQQVTIMIDLTSEAEPEQG